VNRGTYESEMFLRASTKLGLDQAILDSRSDASTTLSTKEIDALLKKGAYHIFNDDETEID
jgi:SNF2 family DNA or RNA helicase